MTVPEWVKDTRRNVYLGLMVLLSGLGWYWGNGLTGDYWYLTWLAPIPILIASLYRSPKTSFWLAFAAYFIGRLSWFAYLETVVSFLPAVLITLALPYVFARIIVYSSTIMLTLDAWYTVLAYPVLMTSFECLVVTLSPDGSATSMAYPQANVLPLIQIASLTGILGITFLVSFFPSFFALCWLAYQQKKSWLAKLVSAAILLFSASFFFSIHRLSNQSPKSGIKVGLLTLAEKKHHKNHQTSSQQVKSVIHEYAQAIAPLARQGTALVLLPETALWLTPQNHQTVVSLLKNIALQNHLQLVVGLANYSHAHARNTALVINPNGTVVADYIKNHLVSGFERQFTPGHQVGLFPLAGYKTGVAICKDLDFPGYIREYGREKITILFVPANDFRVDDWLHSRMAILRGVENGFSVVRTARQGRLTISDHFGRVLYEANSSGGNKTLLVGNVSFVHEETQYARLGNWFGLLNLLVGAYFLWLIRVKKPFVTLANRQPSNGW
ncbi:MAG: Nitrilase/cyanide hydratase and apolipoprotein N-acyltransferase [Spirosoma sp.]|nr:Nitrilase/cyanide hydratase and apolipoprotein N-acyltransferase [Spirosoma sp.]